MNLEKLCEKEPRGVGEMWPGAALDLREVGLADSRPVFAAAGFVGFLNGPDQLLLGHRPVEAAEIAFDLAKIANFVAQFHIADCNNNITICDKRKRVRKIINSDSKR